MITATLAGDRLQLILMPTEQCNFRCVYCYENFSIGRMAPDVISGVKKLLADRASDLKRLDLSWFGGEPLVASDVVIDISKYASELASSHGIVMTGMVTTNGWFLTPEIAAILERYNITNYQITLDGMPDVHDRSRIQRNGHGTFDRIWANLLALKQTSLSFSILLRLHYRPSTIESVKELVHKIQDQLSKNDSRFFINFKAVARLGGPNDEMLDEFDTVQKDAIIAELNACTSHQDMPEGLLRPGQNSDDRLNKICYASKANSFLVRADGRIGKCTVALSDDRNTIGRLTPDGRLEIDAGKVMPWLRGIQTMDFNTMRCPYAGMGTV